MRNLGLSWRRRSAAPTARRRTRRPQRGWGWRSCWSKRGRRTPPPRWRPRWQPRRSHNRCCPQRRTRRLGRAQRGRGEGLHVLPRPPGVRCRVLPRRRRRHGARSAVKAAKVAARQHRARCRLRPLPVVSIAGWWGSATSCNSHNTATDGHTHIHAHTHTYNRRVHAAFPHMTHSFIS